MRKLSKMRAVSLLLTLLLVVMMVSQPKVSLAAAQPTVDLGTTSSFAVLAGTAITNTGATIINGDAGGDIGMSPGGIAAFTGQASVTTNGAIHIADPIAVTAKSDLVTAYDDAAGRAVTSTIPTELGGTTLTPGIYDSASGTFKITGTLKLDAQGDPDGVFIFKTASTLITATGSNITLINGARYCRTFWQVGSSATLGVDSHFVGHIFALTSIAANNGATVQGQLLARNGAVTLDNNTITNGACLVTPHTPAQASLHVIKHVINDNGRTAVAADFNLYVKTSAGINVAVSPAPGVEAPGTTYTLPAGTYVVSEDAFAGYNAKFSGDSDSSGKITLASGDNKTVTITNDDIANSSRGDSDSDSPQSYPPLINIIKTPQPLALTSGQGLVTYTYKVTNPGRVALSDVSVIDDKVTPVNYASGDVNTDKLLQPSETWIYTAKMNINVTTTNTATATGKANGVTATDTAFATVVVTSPVVVTPPVVTPPVVTPPVVTPPVVVASTVTGGQLPKTSTPMYELLLIGVVLTALGVVGWKNRKRYE